MGSDRQSCRPQATGSREVARQQREVTSTISRRAKGSAVMPALIVFEDKSLRSGDENPKRSFGSNIGISYAKRGVAVWQLVPSHTPPMDRIASNFWSSLTRQPS